MPRVRTSDRIHDALRDRIVAGELADGASLSIYRIADEYGVSRTPVRDAVLRLAQAGLVTIERNLGVTVHGIGPREIAELFDVRLLLEVPLAERAARVRTEAQAEELAAESAALAVSREREEFLRHDRDLHALLATIAGAPSVIAILEGLRARTEQRGLSTLERERTFAQVHAEHEAVVAAVVAGDAAAAGAAMRAHLEATGRILVHRAAQRAGVAVDPAWGVDGPTQ